VKIFPAVPSAIGQIHCGFIGIELGKCTVDAFPDGETFVKIEENVRGEDVFLVQSTSRRPTTI